jgi:hypothetical protein
MTIHDVARRAEQVLLEHGHHVPMLVVEGTTQSLVVAMPDLPRDSDEKAGRMLTTGYIVGRDDQVGELRQVFFIAEAWLSAATADKPPSVPPSRDPNRQEVLVISGRAVASRETELVLFQVLRDQQGKLRGLQEWPTDKGTAHSPLLEAFVAGFAKGRQAAA